MSVNQLQEKLREKDKKNANSQEIKNEDNEKLLKLNQEKETLVFDLTEKTLEISVWREKYYDLLGQMEKKTSNKQLSNSQDFDKEIFSLKIQNKELLEKMDILNRIIESHSTERENVEMELKIYKQKLAETEKKPKDNENMRLLMREKEELEVLRDNMKKKIFEDEKKILTLIAEFEKLNTHSTQQEEIINSQENIIKDLRGKGNEKMRNSKGFNNKNNEVLAEKNKENERVLIIFNVFTVFRGIFFRQFRLWRNKLKL